MPKTTPDHTLARALHFFMQGETLNSISKRSDMPSRPTLTKYHDEGVLTDGVPWDVYRKKVDEIEQAKARHDTAVERAEKGSGFMEEMRDFIEQDLFTEMMAKVKCGDVEVTIKDFDTVAKLYAMLNNAAGEKMEFATWFMREVFTIAFDIMDERQYALFKNRVVSFQSEVQEKMNPIPSKMLPEAKA